jgi:hypothetical protein
MNNILVVSLHNFSEKGQSNEVPLQSAQSVEEMLVAKGFKRLVITGLPRDDYAISFSGNLYQLLNSYYNLERLLPKEDSFVHSTFLGDGSLVIVGKISAKSVKVEVESSPMLNASLAYSNSITVPLEEYIQAWRNAARGIIQALE